MTLNRRASLFNGGLEDHDERTRKTIRLGWGDRVRWLGRMNAGTEQGFVCVDVSDSSDHGLIEHCDLDRTTGSPEAVVQRLWSDRVCFGSQSRKESLLEV